MSWQIGTTELDGVVGSRRAQSKTYAEAVEECRIYSLAQHVTKAWLRTYNKDGLGPALVVFVNGKESNEGV